MTTFTKSIFAVELDGKPYAIALPAEKMIDLIAIAAKMADDGKLDLMPVPNKDFFAVAMLRDWQMVPKKVDPKTMPEMHDAALSTGVRVSDWDAMLSAATRTLESQPA